MDRIETNEEMNRETTITVSRRVSSKLQILKHQLGFKSVDEMLTVLMGIVYRQEWSKEDLIEMSAEHLSGSAKNEDEMYEALGVKNFEEKGLKVKGKIKKKKDSK